MNVQMVANDFSLTPSLRDYLERRLRFAFTPVRDRITAVAVRLRDLNGPRGGRDMLCQVCVSMPGQPEVVIKEVQEDMYAAIDLAVKRAAYRAIRLVMRKRQVHVPRAAMISRVESTPGWIAH
ncbi:HPF/RaiA family ribosome-associated protein [Noviherbaspirillum massiliense]|uniref:HPF/RaiA family ribosome-associated protein n=1 Tax=Noviherbaspirillum massiliense TaxID=1465823 RepID=UPI0002F7544F|nr:HPF/RaiA family ribosome-associated protein [Noviherbaspirillum massiliense]